MLFPIPPRFLKQFAQGALAAQSLAGGGFVAQLDANNAALAKIRERPAAVGRQFGLTKDQAIDLADAVGVDLSRGVVESGALPPDVATRFAAYRAAVEAARDPVRPLVTPSANSPTTCSPRPTP
ncbi:hypothetical protein J5X84_41370 [Streptosporangiaceae bacterium NEAU-GS5]|nr:hypothetical protein [Streptosporangiaceae bacterium NEAU-GS5]